MTLPPDESPEVERVVDAISEGETVEWEKERAARAVDAETLEALKLIDTVSRVHRSGDAQAREQAQGNRTWGNLRLLGPIGGGVYGDVYRAFDPALQLEVAVKLWGPTVQPRTIERLLEEARALARVRHPNVLLVYGANVHDGEAGMWTELVEGATLEQLLAEVGPEHWRETAVYGIDLCRALAAVHAVGLVHRDVKAENVMRERGGRIVLMDFGSAGSYVANDGGDASPSPGGTEGTPLAMATEVVNGGRATPASDLFSLGVLLYRLVTGDYPLHASSADELKAAHAKGPLPSLRSVRPDVPDEFADVVARALEREPAKRFASAVDMERALATALTRGWLAPSAPAGMAVATADRRPPQDARPRMTLAWTVAVVLLAAVLTGVWWIERPRQLLRPVPMQFTFDLPLGEDLPRFANVVISPDGSQVAFASVDTSGTSALWVRRFDSLTSMRLPGTEDATYPFWSPDSRQLAFFARGSVKRIGIAGDSVHVICHSGLGRGGSWGPDGTLLIASPLDGPLYRVPASGGVAVPVTTLDTAAAEYSHRWPCFLPDGDHFLYVTTPEHKGAFALYVGSLSSERRVYVGPVESGVVYSSGLLVYMVNEGLEARSFDLHTLRWSGDPRPLSAFPGFGGAPAEPHASVSKNGTLVYAFDATRESRVMWMDVATGAEELVARGPYFDPVLSPDGRRIAAERVEGSGRSNVWMLDVASGTAERWTDVPGLNRKPTWSPRGDSLLYSSSRSGRDALYIRGTDGSLAERLVVPADRVMMWVTDWPARGPVTITRYDPGTTWNLYELRAGVPVPLVATPASESRCAASPDGRWLAYDTNRTGAFHVQLMDLATREEYVLPTPGGVEPRWARRSGRLFFRTNANEFFEVTPIAGRRPTEWPIRRLFRTAVSGGYDVDPDGRRLLCCLKSDLTRPEEVAVLVNMPAAANGSIEAHAP